MPDEKKIEKLLEVLAERIQSVRVVLKGFTMKGRILKSKDRFYIGTSTSLFRILPSEILGVEDAKGNEITE